MTVKQLIEKLQDLPMESDVCYPNDNFQPISVTGINLHYQVYWNKENPENTPTKKIDKILLY